MHVTNAVKYIPFLDLITPHVELEQKLIEVFRNALSTASFIGGPMVSEFEAAFAVFCGAPYSVAVSSGTDALRFAIIACGVRPGDAVLTVANTFIATAEAISQAGAKAEFVDIDERTYNISVEFLQKYLEETCTRNQSGKLISLRSGRPVTAIVPVHLYGQMADMDSIMMLAEQYGLTVIEDACQAHGAEYYSEKLKRWVKAGSMGRASAFSFYPGKNLGACGEGGAVTTNDPMLAEQIKKIRDHGQTTKYYHDVEGYNGRLDAIQAGLLCAKLPYLEKWNAQRRQLATEYNRHFSTRGDVIAPFEPSWSRSAYHLYVVRAKNRDGIMSYLKELGMGTAIHYPVPLHLQKACASLNYKMGDFPVTERVAKEIISLPMFPQLEADQVKEVATAIHAFTLQASDKWAEGSKLPNLAVAAA